MYKIVRVLLWSIGLCAIAIPRAASEYLSAQDTIPIVGVSASKNTMYANDDMVYLSVSLEPAPGVRNCTVTVAIQNVSAPNNVGFTITESPGVPISQASFPAIAQQGIEWSVALNMPSSTGPNPNTGSGTVVEQFVITSAFAAKPGLCAIGSPSTSNLYINVLPGSPPPPGGGSGGGGGGGGGDCPDGGTSPEDPRSCSFGYDSGSGCCLVSGAYAIPASRSLKVWSLERVANLEFNFRQTLQAGPRSCRHAPNPEDNALNIAGGNL